MHSLECQNKVNAKLAFIKQQNDLYWWNRADAAIDKLWIIMGDEDANDWYDRYVPDGNSQDIALAVEAKLTELTAVETIRRTAQELSEFQDNHPRPEY